MPRRRLVGRIALCCTVIGVCASWALGGDWPMWRHDAQRSAATPEKLPDELHLQWVVVYRRLEPAWPDQVAGGILEFDVSYKPVVMGKRMFVGSSSNHSVTALDVDTGKELWRFYADAPVRFAPVAWRDKVFFVSDDGHLYCLRAADGSLQWRFRGGPDDRKVIGNGHLVSMWPARGGPVLADGKIYFAASIWPFMGTFLYAVDAQSGEVIWANSGIGVDKWRRAASYQGSGGRVRPSLYGCVPQGYMTIAGNRLAVPQGRNIPQIFDLKTGQLLFHDIFGMHPGDSADHWYALTAGARVFSGRPGRPWTRHGIRSIDVANLRLADNNPCPNGVTGAETLYKVSRNGAALTGRSARPPFKQLWALGLTPAVTPAGAGSYIKAGGNLYVVGATGELLTVKDVDTDKRRVVVGPKVPGGQVWDMLAADGKLFVVTIDGKIGCFGGKKVAARTHAHKPGRVAERGGRAAARVAGILKATGQTEGYCVVLGLADGELAEGLHVQSKLNVIAVDADEKKVAALRRRMDAAGAYGRRFCVYKGDPLSSSLPPYLANLIVSESIDASVLVKDPAAIKSLFAQLRPYGGKLWLPMGSAGKAAIVAAVGKAKLPGVSVELSGGNLVITRKGAPPGAANRSHSNGSAANTMVSLDTLVRPPLGVLWFGGTSHAGVLPRHGHGPSPQVVDGRMFVEGRSLIRAVDIYTGRLLWERQFKDIGKYFDHGGKQLGPHEIGDNYASAPDGVCVITPGKCMQLDPATGRTTREFTPPGAVGGGANWGSIRILDKLLIATLRPMRPGKSNARDGSASEWLVVFDRGTGEALWSRKARYSWGNAAVIAAKGKVFCADKYPTAKLARQLGRGREPSGKPRLYALEARSGKVLWQTEENLFGGWLGHSQEHDVLVQAGRGRFSGDGDVNGLVALKGSDGSLLWKNAGQLVGPPMLLHDIVVPQTGQVLGILDGRPVKRTYPLTGRQFEWSSRAHACGVSSASEHLLLLRAGGGHAGFVEVKHGFGLNCLNGFRSSCTANMIAAGGVLSVPDYTRACNCQFKNQTSIGLIHMPDVNYWAFDYRPQPITTQIKRLGLNFGGPADRVSEDGTLWLDCPNVGGPGPDVKFTLSGHKTFRSHSSTVKSGPLKWVTSSGISGVTSVAVVLGGSGKYTVRLYFAEPDAKAKPGGRVFSVRLQGKEVLKDFDVAEAAGGPSRGIRKGFHGVPVTDKLLIELTRAESSKGDAIICGLQVIAETKQ